MDDNVVTAAGTSTTSIPLSEFEWIDHETATLRDEVDSLRVIVETQTQQISQLHELTEALWKWMQGWEASQGFSACQSDSFEELLRCH